MNRAKPGISTATCWPGQPQAPYSGRAGCFAFWEATAALDRLQDRLEPGQRAVLVAKLHARVQMSDPP